MLYPKRLQPFSEASFANPSSEYRGTPFWAWNGKLEQNELLRQIDVLKGMGLGGFHMHVRTGMATEYLSDEYMALVGACVEKARNEHMLAWLYDEDRWPSGAAGGFVTKNPDFRARHLLLTREPYSQCAATVYVMTSTAAAARTGNGQLLACYDVVLDESGSLSHYLRIGEEDEAEGFKLYAYLETADPNPWFNNQTYVDTLNPKAVAEFIRLTHERYASEFGKDFGGVVPAIFTDEPQFSHKTTLNFAHETKDVTLPWTDDIPESYHQAYGANVLDTLPELLWELPQGVSKARYRYHDHIAERFARVFADQCGVWCNAHGLMLTGHMMTETTLESQTAALGETMRSYRSFQLPGIDMMCNGYEYTTAKQAQSATRQYSRPGVLSELDGGNNWDFDFRGHKVHGDWQAALGVTVRVPHLSWVSMNGEAKRDYPASFNYQVPWHDQYSYIEDHFARVNTAMTRGEAVCRVGVIHPVESYWLHWGTKQNTHDVRTQMDARFQDLTSWLLLGLIDFDFISESLLPEQCQVDVIAADAFPVGDMKYDVVLVPGCETLRGSTLERLEAFVNAGGRVVFLGGAPLYQDAEPSLRGGMLHERCEHVAFERIAVLNALEGVRELNILASDGTRPDHLLYQLRQDGEERWLFVSQAHEPVNKDLVGGDMMRLQVRGDWRVARYDTLTDNIVPLICEQIAGWTHFAQPMYDHDSLLLRLTKSALGEAQTPEALAGVSVLGAPGKAATPEDPHGIKRFLSPVPVTLSEPNVLLLDLFEWALDDGEWQPMEEILRLDNHVRGKLGWPQRMEAVAQPWVESDDSAPNTVRLRRSFLSELEVSDAKLALECANMASIRLNGEDVPMAVEGWYVDKCIQTVALPTICRGENTIEIKYRIGRKVDLESMYLLGDFGVRVGGCMCIMIAPVRELSFGDIADQGFPFYGGNITYHLTADAIGDLLTIATSCYRGALLSVSIDGGETKPLVFSPYRVVFKDLTPGTHSIDLTCYGSRVNTFGPQHCNNRARGYWWGPNAWRTVGEEWTYEYRLWRQGVLKSPEVFG